MVPSSSTFSCSSLFSLPLVRRRSLRVPRLKLNFTSTTSTSNRPTLKLWTTPSDMCRLSAGNVYTQFVNTEEENGTEEKCWNNFSKIFLYNKKEGHKLWIKRIIWGLESPNKLRNLLFLQRNQVWPLAPTSRGSLPPVPAVLGDPTPSYDLLGHLHAHIYKISKKKSFFKSVFVTWAFQLTCNSMCRPVLHTNNAYACLLGTGILPSFPNSSCCYLKMLAFMLNTFWSRPERKHETMCTNYTRHCARPDFRTGS